MERLKLRYNDAVKSLKTLEEITKEEYSDIIRDATIKRFEYTFESLWKYLKEYLKDREGIAVNSPKAVFREIFSIGLIDENNTEKLLEMTDSRNNTVHTYKEKVANEIYEKIKNRYAELMRKVLNKCRDNL